MFKRLFDNSDNYIEDAKNLEEEITNAMIPIMEKWVNLGFSIRDIGLCMQSGVHDAIITKLMETFKDRKKDYFVLIGFINNDTQCKITKEVFYELTQTSDIIAAIKLLRPRTGLGLKQAKDAIQIMIHAGLLSITNVSGVGPSDGYQTARILDRYKV